MASHVYTRASKANATYSTGLDLPWLNVTAQSGWSTGTAMYFKFTKAGFLCGSNNMDWSVAPYVSAKA